MVDDVVKAMDPNFLILLIYTVVGRCSDRNVVSSYAHIVEIFLDGDSDGGAASPYANNKMWSKAAAIDLIGQAKGISQQFIGRYEMFVHRGRVALRASICHC